MKLGWRGRHGASLGPFVLFNIKKFDLKVKGHEKNIYVPFGAVAS